MLPERTLILAPAGSFDFIVAILQNSPLLPEIVGKIDPNNAPDLPSIISRQNVQVIIFCASAQIIIELMQQLPAGIHFKFHFDETFSIVGSRQKEFPGDCIGVEPNSFTESQGQSYC